MTDKKKEIIKKLEDILEELAYTNYKSGITNYAKDGACLAIMNAILHLQEGE